jgi:Tol biopolymer transport system component
MSIDVGTRLGSLEITALIGKGGMGEVYRARDTKLKREVAIKILPDEFAHDPERVIRFQREAEVLASLNHPNIAAIYDVQEAGATRFLVLELVEGETLAGRIQGGAIPIEEALDIAKHICEALEAAHEKGVIHRDLKPANVKITPEGKVKVLDFGLAKVLEHGAGPSNFSESPTLLSRTLGGVILGTAPYMSPEQARGQPAGEQSDIWAFGAVLYEMLTGGPAFSGETLTDVLGGIVRTEPDWTALPERTPSLIRLLLRQCLQKNLAARLHHIADARIQMDAALNPASIEMSVAQPASTTRRLTLWMVLAVLLPLAVAAATTPFIVWYYRLASQGVVNVRFSVPPPDNAQFGQVGTQPAIALSPDGRKLAFIAVTGGVNRLWIRSLDSVEARPLVGTDGVSATFSAAPFWSPDSRFLAYFAQGKLKRIDVSGGPPQTLCDADGSSGTWSGKNIIVFDAGQAGGPLKRIPATGGKPESVTALDASRHEEMHLYPHFLPDSDHFLFLARGPARENNAIMVGSLTSKEVKLVITADSRVAYDPSGYLLYVREGSLLALPFDGTKLQAHGDPLPIADAVRQNVSTGSAAVALSSNGVLAYRTVSAAVGNYKLTWLDRAGNVLSTLGEAGFNINPKLSPDGKKVAVQRFDPQTGNTDIWIIDVLRGSSTRLTFDGGSDRDPIWSPNGDQIAFSSDEKQSGLYLKSATGVGNPELLLKSPAPAVWDWSADGKFIAYSPSREIINDISFYQLFGKHEPLTYLAESNFAHGLAQFSPDVHWLAYASGEAGRLEVYVQSFPTPSSKWQVSTGGGLLPRWRQDGKEIFYLGNDRKLRAVRVRPSDKDKSFDISTPEVLFEVPSLRETVGNVGALGRVGGYDVAADGQAFLFNVLVGEASNTPTPITVITNWTASLKR